MNKINNKLNLKSHNLYFFHILLRGPKTDTIELYRDTSSNKVSNDNNKISIKLYKTC